MNTEYKIILLHPWKLKPTILWTIQGSTEHVSHQNAKYSYLLRRRQLSKTLLFYLLNGYLIIYFLQETNPASFPYSSLRMTTLLPCLSSPVALHPRTAHDILKTSKQLLLCPVANCSFMCITKASNRKNLENVTRGSQMIPLVVAKLNTC